MGRILVEVQVAAPPGRVWHALTDPAEVTAWAGVSVLAVPAGYPVPGQHARWRSALGPLRVTLHDRVVAVEPERRLAASLDVAFVHVDEEYRLAEGGTGTLLVSENAVRARWPGLGWLAERVVRRDVTSSLERLRAHCLERPGRG